MVKLQGRGIFGGEATGPALVTRSPMNFTAAFTKPINILPWKRAVVMDHHHELFKKDVRGKVLVFPACVGSTYSGLVLLDLMHKRAAPAAMIVRAADSLLVSGSALAETWFAVGIPVVEYDSADLLESIHTGDLVAVDGETGEIRVG